MADPRHELIRSLIDLVQLPMSAGEREELIVRYSELASAIQALHSLVDDRDLPAATSEPRAVMRQVDGIST